MALLAFCYVANAEWNIEAPSKGVPQELEGTIFGRTFTLGKATWDNMTLSIASSESMGHWPESELIIFLSNDEEKSEWYVTPDSSSFDNPHIHMKFGKKGQQFPGTLMFTSEYSMYLKVFEKTDNSATIQVHISLPDYKKSTLIGTFEAKLER